jgi:hypothetical protein
VNRSKSLDSSKPIKIKNSNNIDKMKADLISLPKELLYLVANYLLAVDQQNKMIYEFSFDWKNFMNTSKELFGEWKKQARKIVLKPTHASKYTELEQFRNRILPLIEVPSTQLELQIDSFHKDFDSKLISKALSMNIGCIYVFRYNMTGDALPFPAVCPNLSKFDVYGVLGSSLIDLSQLTILEEASFSSIKLLNYHTLSHLKSLSISNTTSITDVSCFRNISKLSFHQCHKITDVSGLGNVHDLRFTYCERITDISSLRSVHSLELTGCYGVTDVSPLGNVHTLKVGSVVASVLGISDLRNVSELNLQWPKVTSLSGLTNLTKLSLFNSDTIADISALKNLKELHIDNCPNISNFQGLKNLETLELRLRSDWTPNWRYFITGGMEVIEKLKTLRLQGMTILDFSRPTNEKSSLSWPNLVNIRHLSLEETNFSQIPTTLSRLQSLTIKGDPRFNSLPELPSLGSLVVESCNNLRHLHVIGASLTFPVYSVKILNCVSLKTVEVSRKVSKLNIVGCKKLISVVANSPIDHLEAVDCPKLYLNGDAKVGFCSLNS